MKEIYDSLRELEDIDDEIAAATSEVEEVTTELETVTAPIDELEKQVGSLETELRENRTRAGKLEQAAKEKRAKLKEYEQRLSRVRTSREEAAVNTEVDLVRKAADADEAEAIDMMERVTRQELRADELREKLDETRQELEPQRDELEKRRKEAEKTLAALTDRRQTRVDGLEPLAREAYTKIKGGRRGGRALAALTPDGACGNCYSMLPLQRQSEVRRNAALVRCEYCGVILHAPE